MYFDFEDYRPETPSVPSAISRREGILLSLIGHLVAIVAILTLPTLPFVREAEERRLQELEQRRLEMLARQREAPRFVFVQPRIDMEAAQPPPVADLSDKDRIAQAPERALDPSSRLPFARGNTTERVEALEAERPRGRGPTPDPSPPAPQVAETARGADGVGGGNGGAAPERLAPDSIAGLLVPPEAEGAPASRPAGGALGEALRNLDRYVQQESFHNPDGGGGQFGPWIQFDTKGVEFGPWIRRFVAQVRRNWFIPYAAMSLKGRVVLTFYVHRDGTIAELTVVGPSSVESFNNAAYNALAASNPTHPLPPEYPADRAFFTVTFYYNETPPGP